MGAAYYFVEIIEAEDGSVRGCAKRFFSRGDAIRACDELQAELDRERDPARCFVFDRSGIAIAAGREHPASRHNRKPDIA